MKTYRFDTDIDGKREIIEADTVERIMEENFAEDYLISEIARLQALLDRFPKS